MRDSNKTRGTFSAWLCLLAAGLLYAPLAAMAWSAHAMSCCYGDHCPIREHHHQQAQTQHTDCEHETQGLGACSMNCCQNPDKPALTSLAFVLFSLEFAAGPRLITGMIQILHSVEIQRSSKPLSPPPRFTFAVL